VGVRFRPLEAALAWAGEAAWAEEAARAVAEGLEGQAHREETGEERFHFT